MWTLNGAQPDYSALCQLPLFSGVAPRELAEGGQELDFCEERFSRGQRIISRGQRMERPLLILSGLVRMYSPADERQKEDALAELSCGDLLGMENFFSHPGSSPCDILVISSECRCLSFCLSALRETDSRLSRLVQENWLRMLSDGYIKMLYWLCVLSQRGLREKILTFAELMCGKTGSDSFQLRMNQEEFAAYLRVARPSLNRELQAMQRDGLLSIEERTYTVLRSAPPNQPCRQNRLKETEDIRD